jgi:glycosyltransferase involved in cell wall biosynthesis
MRVGLDVHVLTGPPQGTASVWRNLLPALPAENSYVLYSFDPGATAAAFPQAHFEHRGIPIHQPHLRILAGYAWLARRDRCDVFHTNYYAPLVGVRGRVLTIHDLVYVDFPEFSTGLRSLQQRVLGRASARAARGIITDSEYAQGRIAHHFDISRDRITVVYPGLSAVWQVPDEPAIAAAWATLRARLPERYMLGVGRMDPRKGVLVAARVAHALREEDASDGLVWVGPSDFGADAIERELRRSGMDRAVIRVGDLSLLELQALYRHAQLLLFPSLAEGFGYPPLEAMAMGTPAVVSNRTSIPEVCGDGGLVVDPVDVRALTEAARSVLRTPALREALVARGRRRVAGFTNSIMADRTVEVYRRAAPPRRVRP